VRAGGAVSADLELVSTDTLLEELERRFDTMVFSGLQRHADRGDHVHRHTSGQWLHQIALAFDLATQAREKFEENGEPGEPS
jgi:hypothetical protein